MSLAFLDHLTEIPECRPVDATANTNDETLSDLHTTAERRTCGKHVWQG